MKIGTRLAAVAALVTLAPSAAAAPQDEKPVKVFILAGQSNMEGAGAIHRQVERNGGKGSLEHLVTDPETRPRFAHLVDAEGAWVVREDVRIWYLGRKGGLTVGYGAREDRIGPELQFGHVVGDHYEAPVLLIKVAWGGKSLAQDFRPPSSGGEVGPYYLKLFEHVREVLADLDELFPGGAERGYEIVGFGWHQGWNDRVNQAFNDEYETNLAHFIRDVRKELGIAKLPFVIAETGMTGPEEKHPRALSLMRAQAAVAEYEEFRGNVAFVGTRAFYRPPEESPSNQGYHWNSNAETYFLIGDAMGKAMLGLVDAARERR
jgi:alpha-galactosidase